KLVQIAQKPACGLGNHNAVRLYDALQACREVRRLTDNSLLLRSSRADQIANNHQPRRHPDARLDGRRGLQSTSSSDQLQPCSNSPFRIVLMRLRITKVDQDPIAHVFRYEATEALHSLRDALLVGRNDLAEVFRVHASRECR